MSAYMTRAIELPMAREIHGLAAFMSWARREYMIAEPSSLSEKQIDQIAKRLLSGKGKK